jgi:hypothetical protein
MWQHEAAGAKIQQERQEKVDFKRSTLLMTGCQHGAMN